MPLDEPEADAARAMRIAAPYLQLETALLEAALKAAPGSGLRRNMFFAAQQLPTSVGGQREVVDGVDPAELLVLLEDINSLIKRGRGGSSLRRVRNHIEEALDLFPRDAA